MYEGVIAVPSLRYLLSDALDIPKELVMNLPRITMVGNLQIVVENHRGILDFTSQEVRVALSRGVVGVSGVNLTLRSMDQDELVVDGELTRVWFESEGQNHD
jgi:sporulation protein YqfC